MGRMPSTYTGSGRARGWRNVTVLGDRTGSRDNNFDVLRLLAASVVLISHSFALTGHVEPLHALGTSLGGLGVLVFFGISGLLIHRSWQYDPQLRSFWKKRALRLVPGLAVMAVLTAVVLGPVATTTPLRDYATSLESWAYPLRVTLLVPFGAELPGVFDSNPYPSAVNGSLWSLPVEVVAYALLAMAGMVGLLSRRAAVAALAVAALVAQSALVTFAPASLKAVGVIAAFAVGAAMYSFRDRVPLDWRVAILAGIAVVASAGTALQTATWTLCLVYLTFFIAYAMRPLGRRITRYGDASYGLYIYAFPIQQLVVLGAAGDIGPWTLAALSFPPTLVAAHLSWRLVERPALRWKPRPATPPTDQPAWDQPSDAQNVEASPSSSAILGVHPGSELVAGQTVITSRGL